MVLLTCLKSPWLIEALAFRALVLLHEYLIVYWVKRNYNLSSTRITQTTY